eukprot:71105_1
MMLHLINKLISLINQRFGKLSKIVFSCFLYLVGRYCLIKSYRKYNRMPPGPIGYPIFGCFISVASKGHKFYIDLIKQTNDKINTVPMGKLPVICINDVKLMKDILNKDCVTWRPKNMFQIKTTAPLAGVFGGPSWKKRRKFFQSNLMTMLNKKFVGKNVKLLFHQTIIPKLDKLSNDSTKLWYCHDDFQYLTFNINYCCIFGGYVKEDDELYLNYVKDFNLFLYYLQFYVLSYLLLGETITTFIRTKLITDRLDNIYSKQLDKTRKWAIQAHKNYDKNNLQTYYDFTCNQLSQNQSTECDYNDIITNEVLADFEVALEAGTDTTAATLEYCLAVATKYPKLQNEIYNEILKNVGDIKDNIDEFNPLDYLHQLHKLRAFVFEALRMIPVVPINLFRQIRKKNGLRVKVDDETEYILPDNSVVITNIIGMQMNENLWDKPNQFNIHRWLDGNGKFNRKLNPHIMSFSFGLRECPGKLLALKTLYLAIAILFSKYEFFRDDAEQVNIDLKMTFVLHVDPQIGCKVKRRER